MKVPGPVGAAGFRRRRPSNGTGVSRDRASAGRWRMNRGTIHTLRTMAAGLGLGMVLQLAVGPVCLFVFSEAVSGGFRQAMVAVLAVTLVDAAWVVFALAGLAAVPAGEQGAKRLRLVGAAVLLVFGADFIATAQGMPLVPSIKLNSGWGLYGPFVRGLVLTGSNPLTIVFWAGVFSARAAGRRSGGGDLALYGAGAAAATPVFLAAVSFAGAYSSRVLSPRIILILNTIIGLMFVYFAVMLLAGKRRPLPSPGKEMQSPTPRNNGEG